MSSTVGVPLALQKWHKRAILISPPELQNCNKIVEKKIWGFQWSIGRNARKALVTCVIHTNDFSNLLKQAAFLLLTWLWYWHCDTKTRWQQQQEFLWMHAETQRIPGQYFNLSRSPLCSSGCPFTWNSLLW